VEGRHRSAQDRADDPIAATVFKWARLAGLPRAVTDRAREIPSALEHVSSPAADGPRSAARGPTRLTLFQASQPDDALRRRIVAIDVDRMTPLEALTVLAALKQESQE
jgi:DNA mismatch repair protein MutS